MVTLEIIALFVSFIFMILFIIAIIWRLREIKIKRKKEKILKEEFDIRNLKDITEISENSASTSKNLKVLKPEINVLITKDGPVFIDQRSKWCFFLQPIIDISLPILAFLIFIIYLYLKNILAIIWFINALSQAYALKPEYFKKKKKKETTQ